jgi:3-hydroxyisobutyrate dehydrogenase-like beta-hydroxyacid dehydrogenase
MKVGFIGLGRMGQAISGRIIEAGFDLTVYNRTRAKADELEKKGAKVADSIAEAAAGRDVVFTMLADDKALAAVAEDGLLDNLPKGSIHVPMGTHSVTALLELKAKHDALGQVFVAAPVLGRPDAAAAGQLGIVPGGSQACQQHGAGLCDRSHGRGICADAQIRRRAFGLQRSSDGWSVRRACLQGLWRHHCQRVL